MSDTRRRRKSEQSGGSEDLSESYDDLNVTKEIQTSEPTEGHRDSEYDTAGSENESEVGSQDGGQRESGDGQEEDKPQKKLDDDEDRRNPQYIPKRGTFYEHDDRTAEEASEATTDQPPDRENKEKKVWKDKEDRWDHDRYNDEEQAPKSHEELIAVYGYDIRNEEGPPRARRRRRYGRGPNKYTRNWEDENAYGKTILNQTSGKQQRRSNRSGEEFPALKGSQDAPENTEEPVISSAWYSNKNKIQNKSQNFPPLQTQQDNETNNKSTGAHNNHIIENKAPNEPTNPAWKKDAKYTPQSLSPTRNAQQGEPEKMLHPKQNHVNKRQVQESVSLAASRARGRGFKPNGNNINTTRAMETKGPKGRGGGVISNENIRRNASLEEEKLVNDIKHINMNDASNYHHQGRPTKNFYAPPANQQRSNLPPPRMQQPQHAQQPPPQQAHPQSLPDVAGNRPKRYSSLRQRPTIPDGPAQQNYPQQHGYYPAQAYQQGHFEQPPSVTSGGPMGGQPVMSMAPPGGQPAPYAPPPFLVPPPQFIPPQTAPPSIINYVPGPNGPPFQPNYQGYQSYTPAVQPQGPPPPPELFQPQGCTYYSPAQQPQPQPQAAPVRRPKAAIPILPPPENNQHHQAARGRGRTSLQNNSPSNPQANFDSESRIEPPEVKSPAEAFENAHTEPIPAVDTQPIVEIKAEPALIETVDKIADSLEDNLKITEIRLPEPEMLATIDVTEENITKAVDIQVDITDNEINKVESVVIENPVVEQTAA